MIKDPITITVFNSYDIVKWEKFIIEKCMLDNPSSTMPELAKLLNITERTLYRKIKDYKLTKPRGIELYINNINPPLHKRS